MELRYPDVGQPYAVLSLDTPADVSLLRLALDRMASGMTHVAAHKNRSDAREAYEALCGNVNCPTDDFYRSAECTGGQWCRCPVTTPCETRGTSHITGFSADADGIQRVTRG